MESIRSGRAKPGAASADLVKLLGTAKVETEAQARATPYPDIVVVIHPP